MLLEKIRKPEGTLKEGDDLCSWSPPLIAIRNWRPVLADDAESQSDWEKSDKYRDYKASDSATENKATNEPRSLYRPNTKTHKKIGSDATHRLPRRLSLSSSVDSPDRKLPPITPVSF